MFSAKNYNKIPSTAREVQRNKICLEAFANLNPFEKKSDGKLRYPSFADYLKVVLSLRVTDDLGFQVPRQTADLQHNIMQTAFHDTYVELVYNAEEPTLELYLETLEEKLMINLANLVLQPEIKSLGVHSAAEIARIKEAFAQMLRKA